ncbi:hypothetical protein ACHAWF_008119 [Thalassiosira exigua]
MAAGTPGRLGRIICLLIAAALSSPFPARALLPSPSTASIRRSATFVTRQSQRHRRRRAQHDLSRTPVHSLEGRIDALSTPLSLLPAACDVNALPSPLLLADAAPESDMALDALAEGLGYLVGAASVLLYAPIAVRVLRTGSARGLTASTWWLKLTSYTSSVVYNVKNGFPIAAYSETLVITLEAAIILGLVKYYQKGIDAATLALACAYIAVSSWALLSPSNVFPWGPPDEWINSAQILSTALNASALLPQLKQNWDRQASGDYSPVTASLATAGCCVRLFTTAQLADGDALLLLNYGTALVLNLSLLLQVLYFGTQKEGKSLIDLFLADVKSSDEITDGGEILRSRYDRWSSETNS